jgi:CcmD family protein
MLTIVVVAVTLLFVFVLFLSRNLKELEGRVDELEDR